MKLGHQPASVRRPVKTKWLWLAAFLVACGLFLLVIYLPGGASFQVNGLPFRVWVAQHPNAQIQDPLAAIGTNAIPHLARILLEPEESVRVFQAKAWVWKHLPQGLQTKLQEWYPVPRWQLKRTALFGLRSLGPEAKDALPYVLRVARTETNRMVRASALTAALAISPESPETFEFWRDEWQRTNCSRRDLAIYLHSARHPIPAATPLLLEEAKGVANPVTIVEAFEFMGEAARPAVPYMINVFREGTYRGNMLQIFKRLGPVAAQAVPDLASVLTEGNPGLIAATLDSLKSVGPDARPALPTIQPLLTNNDAIVRMLAAAAAAHIESNAGIALPVLMDGLEDRLPGKSKISKKIEIRQPEFNLATSRHDETAAILLGELGPAASPALPALELRLGHSNQWIRMAAAQAVWRISADPRRALPVLVDVVDSQAGPSGASPNYELIRAIEIIEEIGPAARAATPALGRVRTLSISARHAANAALTNIGR